MSVYGRSRLMNNASLASAPLANYYSQQGEDYLLDAFFGFRPNGYFVDVGAFDGVHLSNSYIFEQRGWSGLCIEAAPFYFELCAKNRPGTRCIHAACVAVERGPVEFRFERGGLFSGINVDPNDVAREFATKRIEFEGFEHISVPSCSLNAVLGDSVSEIDFVSIDVEGSEIDVLNGLDLERYRPRVLLLEANNNPALHALDAHLAPRGYHRARSMRWNHFYARDKADILNLHAVSGSANLKQVPHPLDPKLNPLSFPVGPLKFGSST
jgi:FkbM family methyltransferase